MIDLAEFLDFLLARIAEDEQKIAHMTRERDRVRSAPIYQGYPADWLFGVDIFVSPDRWRVECEVKRRIVAEMQRDWFGGWLSCEAAYGEGLPCNVTETTIRLLALPYADHPDFKPEWRP